MPRALGLNCERSVSCWAEQKGLKTTCSDGGTTGEPQYPFNTEIYRESKKIHRFFCWVRRRAEPEWWEGRPEETRQQNVGTAYLRWLRFPVSGGEEGGIGKRFRDAKELRRSLPRIAGEPRLGVSERPKRPHLQCYTTLNLTLEPPN